MIKLEEKNITKKLRERVGRGREENKEEKEKDKEKRNRNKDKVQEEGKRDEREERRRKRRDGRQEVCDGGEDMEYSLTRWEGATPPGHLSPLDHHRYQRPTVIYCPHEEAQAGQG